MAGDGGQKHQGAHHHAHIATVEENAPKGQMIIVGVLVALLGGGGIWYLNRAGEDNKLNSLFNSADARHMGTSNGQRGNVTLADGSILSIGPATKLTIIPDYNKQYRGIQVDGTLKIEVKEVGGTPLELRAGGGALVLNGGTVSIRSYADEGDAIIKLESGTATVRAKEARREVTGPIALHVGKDSSLTDADAAMADVATSWSTGKVQIQNQSLKDVLVLFNKYYALNMKVADDALLSRMVTMEADLDSKQAAIDALQAAAFVKFGYDGSTPMLRDDPAAAARAARAKK